MLQPGVDGDAAYNSTMSFPRFHCPGLVPGAEMDLPEAAAHHAVRVLRLAAGDSLVLFDGEGGEVHAQISAADKRGVTVRAGERQPIERESSLVVTLVQSLQAADKMDYTVQKAVELGVTRIIPVESRRSVVRLDGARADKRVQHWRQVAVSACEQCGRNRVPEIAAVQPLAQWLGLQRNPATRLLLSPAAEHSLATLPRPDAVELLIGPEGGLDDSEVQAAALGGYHGVRLGPRVLRTETAGLAAVAAMQALWGDFL